jgi:hypothetical protein
MKWLIKISKKMILIHLIKGVIPLKETESIGENCIGFNILEPADLHDVNKEYFINIKLLIRYVKF